MSQMREDGKSSKQRVQSVWNAAMCLQGLQIQIHAKWKDTSVFGRSAKTSHADLLLRRKRERCWENSRHEQSKCIQLDKKNRMSCG